MWGPLPRWGGERGFPLGSPHRIQTSLHLVTWNTSLNLSHCWEIRPSFESDLSRYMPVETESTDSLSPTYCWGKTPLEVLMENWLTSSVKDSESALILRRYVVHGIFFNCCAEMNIHIDLRRVSQRISVVSSRRSSHLYCILWNMAYLWSQWRGNGFISIWFGVHRAILHSRCASVFISFCDSVPGDSLVFNQENRGSLRVWLGILDSSACNAQESRLISQREGCLIRFVELRQQSVVYSRVTAGMAIRNSTLFSEVRTPV